ncbi:glycoside hydrolase family 38 C-terminal domain-containing protein [Clavibacter tessellarius]|uniref:glycoside hydrolase family 38 C-terminal domain-containing protein n=1 Tax=Clavibacter tessellarius TaxID=31965 RepID=UPI0039BF50DA
MEYPHDECSTRCGARCCCSSSTTSCPAPPSRGCTRRPSASTPACRAGCGSWWRRRRARSRHPATGGSRSTRRRWTRTAWARCRPRSWIAPRLPAPVADGDGWVLDNGLVRARFAADGTVSSLVDHASGRDLVAPGQRLGLLQLFRDTPNQWDAWDIDDAYRRNRTDLTDVAAVRIDGAALVVERAAGSSASPRRGP